MGVSTYAGFQDLEKALRIVFFARRCGVFGRCLNEPVNCSGLDKIRQLLDQDLEEMAAVARDLASGRFCPALDYSCLSIVRMAEELFALSTLGQIENFFSGLADDCRQYASLKSEQRIALANKLFEIRNFCLQHIAE